MRVIILVILIVAVVFVVHAVQGERTAVLPIKVWTNLVPEHGCVIWPLEGYTVGVPMLDTTKHPESDWFTVVSDGCSGVARVGR